MVSKFTAIAFVLGLFGPACKQVQFTGTGASSPNPPIRTDKDKESPADPDQNDDDTDPNEKPKKVEDPSKPDAKVLTEEELEALCSRPESVRKISLKNEFPQPSTSCRWGQDSAPVAGNLGKKDLRISARYEETKSLGIPQEALLCRLTVKFFGEDGGDKVDMYYDDEIFVLLNDLVIASSKNYGTRLATRNGFQVYDWSKLVGTPYRGNDPGPYCVDGTDTCSIPKTQTQGTMTLTVSDATVQKLALASGMSFEQKSETGQTQKSATLGFVTTGDNDNPIDCKHSTVGFSVSGEFIIP